jgi:prophage regulatory protein
MDARDRIIRSTEVERITGRSRVSIWRDEKAGTFPRRVRIGKAAVGWRLSEVMNWLNTREVV